MSDSMLDCNAMVENFVNSLSKAQRHDLWMFLGSLELLSILDSKITGIIFGKDLEI